MGAMLLSLRMHGDCPCSSKSQVCRWPSQHVRHPTLAQTSSRAGSAPLIVLDAAGDAMPSPLKLRLVPRSIRDFGIANLETLWNACGRVRVLSAVGTIQASLLLWCRNVSVGQAGTTVSPSICAANGLRSTPLAVGISESLDADHRSDLFIESVSLSFHAGGAVWLKVATLQHILPQEEPSHPGLHPYLPVFRGRCERALW